MKPLLEVRNLRKEFDGIVAVRDLSFSLQAGTITALIGPNGAGKTTVFNLITGFMRPDDGQVLLRGRPITGRPPHEIAALGVARTFQRIRLFSHLTVLDHLLLAMPDRTGEDLLSPLIGKRWINRKEKEKREWALDLLRRVGLAHKQDAHAGELSHGQRKLLELARALATGAELFLLDEPTAGVFPDTRRQIMDLFGEMKDEGKTLLIIEHNMRVVMGISDRVLVLSNGENIADAPPGEVVRKKRVIEAYLGGDDDAS